MLSAIMPRLPRWTIQPKKPCVNYHRRQLLSSTALATKEDSSMHKGPLRDIKVLDLSRILAGPFASQMLGQLLRLNLNLKQHVSPTFSIIVFV